jgi:hypothetical protein
MWEATNKTTKVKYPVSDAEKAAYEADPNTKDRFSFRKVSDAPKTAISTAKEPPVTVFKNTTAKPEQKIAPEPIEAKKVETEQ